MREDLLRLRDLQNAETRVREIRHRLEDIPGRLATLAVRRRAVEESTARAEARRGDLQKARREGEAGIRDLEDRREHYRGQLMEVKSNREYVALQHEIGLIQEQIGRKEEEVLLVLEELDRVEAEVLRAQDSRQSQGREIEAEEEGLRREEARARAELQAAENEVLVCEKGIPAPVIQLYRRIASQRGGIGIAAVVHGACEACRAALRPALVAEVRDGGKVATCEGCRRILYLEPLP